MEKRYSILLLRNPMHDYLDKPPLLIKRVSESLTQDRRDNAQAVADVFNKHGRRPKLKVEKCLKKRKN